MCSWRKAFGKDMRANGAMLGMQGVEPDGKVWCVHCNQQMPVSEVRANAEGDYCTTAGCVGGGFGYDLFADRWWLAEDPKTGVN